MSHNDNALESARLRYWNREALDLSAALADARPLVGDLAWALLYAPKFFRLASVDESARFFIQDDKTIDPATVFEARVFGDGGELRWRYEPTPPICSGRAVFLSEGNNGPGGWTQQPDDGPLWRLPNRYLLWGRRAAEQSAKLPPHWSCLAEPRIGQLHVPHVRLDAEQRVALVTFEYAGPADGEAGSAHGNTVIRDERLCRFEAFRSTGEEEAANG